MPSYLQIDNISKSYGTKILFDHIGFNINEGDKIALVAPNGTGKTSLLRILAGKDSSDSGGSIKFLRNIRIAFLEQEYDFDPSNTIARQLNSSDYDEQLRANRILDELGLYPDILMGSLSGGEVKRVAITKMLSCDADFLIMDEPTNHLDLDAIEYLEKALKRSRCTLFLVSHDRYFLDRVCNTVMEMDRGTIYVYKGDYENFLRKREERINNYNAETERIRNIFRRELEWIHATPCARSGKAKYRKEAFKEIKARAENVYTVERVSMDGLQKAGYLGKQVIDCKDVSFAYGDKVLIRDFSYNFSRGERVGVVGGNGIGKSSFLNLLAESDNPAVKRGESVRIGYYRQNGLEFDGNDTVMETVQDTHLLERFLFPREMWNTAVGRLSGGEKRRLYLLTVLMQEPNVLILDEPTNDLDIVTLNILEEYLLDFKGTLIIVTHDRHFLDRLVDHLFVFCGNGVIKDFSGGYSEYRSYMEDLRREERAARQQAERKAAPARPRTDVPRKLSWKEKRELEQLEVELDALGAEKKELENLMAGGTEDYQRISEASARYEVLAALIDEKETRWLELSEFS
ncbi:MAG: ABC-F family ATP-binding cassette domain-containing protein [Bacteroidales bacterium]|nr:ABC-F family ATP-binding cassette domain-containing protein [Bacteroidales bacterium]